MRIELTENQIERQNEFEEFVKKFIKPYVEENDRTEILNKNIIKAITQNGYLGAMIPKKYNGMEFDSITLGLLIEEIGKKCSSSRSLLTVHGMVALAISRWGTDEQKESLLPRMASGELIGAFGLTEPNVGSDAKSIETNATLKGDKYVLNGMKKWITMGQIADIFLIFAQCEGKPTAFLIEKGTPGFSIRPMKGLIGGRASMIAELNMKECAIPKENIVGKQGTGLSHIALTCLDYGRYTIAWGCIGLGYACLQETIEYVKTRRQFGEYLRQYQLIQKMITEMVVNLKAARLLCLNAGYLKDIGAPDSIMETWNAKYFASKIINSITGDAIQIYGANGCSNEYPIERYFRDAKINEVIEGTSQMHEILIATNAIRYS